jgi:hypothetical protein
VAAFAAIVSEILAYVKAVSLHLKDVEIRASVENKKITLPLDYNLGCLNVCAESAMTLHAENGAPAFYTFATFRPGRCALFYGGLLSLLAFCAVTFVFNYGIKEKLWSFEGVPYGYISPSAPTLENAPSASSASRETIVGVVLPDHILRSLTGTYFSAEANRKYLISLNNGRLSLCIDSQQLIELVPTSEDTLYAGEGHIIKFRVSATGSIDRLDLYDNGRHIIAHRQ